MPTVPATAKQPTDRKQAGEGVEFDPVFSFEHGGATYTFDRPTEEVLTPGFLRKNRHDETELIFGLFEALASAEVLEVIDNMSHPDFQAVSVRFIEHQQLVLGGSTGN